MITIRLPKRQWATASRVMIEVAPVRLVAADPIYEVLPAHLELLDKQDLSFAEARREMWGIFPHHDKPTVVLCWGALDCTGALGYAACKLEV